LYRRLEGPQGQSGQVQKISSLLGFDPQTTQPIVSHYTNYIILAHNNVILHKEIIGTYLAACHMLRTTAD
jgi:hypothetical protein